MPYVFGGLIILNVLTLVYFMFLGEPTPTNSIVSAQQELSKPIGFINNSAKLPPIIGTKK